MGDLLHQQPPKGAHLGDGGHFGAFRQRRRLGAPFRVLQGDERIEQQRLDIVGGLAEDAEQFPEVANAAVELGGEFRQPVLVAVKLALEVGFLPLQAGGIVLHLLKHPRPFIGGGLKTPLAFAAALRLQRRLPRHLFVEFDQAALFRPLLLRPGRGCAEA